MSDDRTAKIVAAQVRAAELQKACKWCPPENFFANMIGHMGLVYGPAVAAEVVTLFEITRQEHEEMIDSMARNPKAAADAFRAGVAKFVEKRNQRKAS